MCIKGREGLCITLSCSFSIIYARQIHASNGESIDLQLIHTQNEKPVHFSRWTLNEKHVHFRAQALPYFLFFITCKYRYDTVFIKPKISSHADGYDVDILAWNMF